MITAGEDEAWLETPAGKRYAIHGSCSLGRTGTNTIVLDSPNVSRHHALIHVQNIGEFWLIDFGSSNGTLLNKRRIHQPLRLGDGDQISVGDNTYTFRQPREISDEYKTVVMQQTLRQLGNVPCWLLVTDICDFTPLSRSMQSEGLEKLVGVWISTCKEIIEKHHGRINKYLGDGFLAYWLRADHQPEMVATAISALKEFRETSAPPFRIVVHFGLVAIGGVASMGEESLMGKEVNLVFRIEKLASSLGENCVLSDAARAKLGELISVRSLGEFELKGFEEKCLLFAG